LSPFNVLAAAKLAPLYYQKLAAQFVMHDRPANLDSTEFAKVAGTIQAIAAQGETVLRADLIDRLPALKLISVMGVGYDGIDVAFAKSRGVVVTHTPNVLNDDVADLALGLMIATSRQLCAADRFVRAASWTSGPMPLARKMSGARIGLVGMGRIGQAIAHRAQAFGMSIAYTSRSPKSVPYRYLPTSLALAAEVDFLVIITPGGASTLKMINAEVLAALGKNGILINVARGSVVDESALMDALEKGIIAGAGLDVFESEPNVPERLRVMPHVVLTPHIGSATAHTRGAMADLALANLRACFDGQPLLTPVPECMV
jgi:lactate dehydrogenase-like 2-hydroxyacid dehydrogenase